MKNGFISFALMLFFFGCANFDADSSIEFDFFNKDKYQILVTDIVGLPDDACPGILMPARVEIQPMKSSTLPGGIRLPDKIKIVWKENGEKGWHGASNLPANQIPGTTHQAEFSRVELGMPKKLVECKISLTYLGHDKWRIVMTK